MSKAIRNAYKPDYVSPPGETLAETLEYIGMSQSELARRIGRPIKTINEIINGKTAITPETALQLEFAVGVASRFWLNRENDYRAFLARESETITLKTLSQWIKRFPVAQMVEYRWLPASDSVESTARSLLSFFGVASEKQYEEVELARVAFRRSQKVKSNPDAVAAWFRKGIVEAQSRECASYNQTAFQACLKELRTLTARGPDLFEPRMKDLCAAAGVAVVFVRELRGAPVNGAASWLTPKKAMVALSLRYKTNDVLWFSFFHEAAHLLSHGRREVFVDLNDHQSTGDESLEQEADKFAAEFLIPKSELTRFLTYWDRSQASVEKFAAEIGIHAGIVVGRLQHDGHLARTHLNGLKLQLEWRDNREK